MVDATVLAVVARGWADRLGVPPEWLERPGTRTFTRHGLTAVVALRLGDATVAVAPPDAVPALDRLSGAQLLDPATMLSALAAFAPRLLGAATLAYADGATLRQPSAPAARAASAAEVADLVASGPADEAAESGVADMVDRLAVTAPDGTCAAVAGYQPWGDAIANVGVLTRPALRGRGLGRAVAAAASHRAIEQGLVPQWRCRVGNDASARLGASLGFVVVGRQLALEVARGVRQR